MSTNYYHVAAGLFLYFTGISIAASQSGPEFLECSLDPVRLCVQDEGVRLPASNQIYVGDLNPDASRCSVHLRRSLKVKSTCGTSLQYEVRLYTHDTSAAIILQPPTFISTDSSSTAELFFDTENASDEIVRMQGLSYSAGCADVHRIEWIVTDSCGVENRCEQFFDLYDCAPAQIQLKSALTILPFNYSTVINVQAKQFFISARDDCSFRGELQYSFSKYSFKPDSVISCDYIPAFGVELPLDIWIAGHGVDTNCDGSISWEERNRDSVRLSIVYTDVTGSIHCGWFTTIFTLSGRAVTPHMKPIENVLVGRRINWYEFNAFTSTNREGKFYREFADYSMPVNIAMIKEDDPRNGVSTLDMIKLRKHLIGEVPFQNPYQIIAGDANISQNTSTIDIVELSKLIVGIYDQLPYGESWRFIPSDFQFIDPEYPWPFDEELALPIQTDIDSADFIGIKIGDVDFSATTLSGDSDHQSAYPVITFQTDDQVYHPNEEIEIPISFQSEGSLLGFQFTLSSPDLRFESIDYPSGENLFVRYGIFEDEATLSVMKFTTEAILPGEIIFTVKVRAVRYGSLSRSLTINSNITDAEAYNTAEEILKPVLQFDGRIRHQMAGHPASHPRNHEATRTPVLTVEQSPEVNVYAFPIHPNPWRESSVLTFFLQDESEITFTACDASGRKAYAFEKPYPAGYHEIELSKENFPQEGIYFFNLQSDRASTGGKFVVLK